MERRIGRPGKELEVAFSDSHLTLLTEDPQGKFRN